jgi:hypothetical protein
MPVPEEARKILDAAVETSADHEAFTAGYMLALDPANCARFIGDADTRFAVVLDMPNQTATWVEGRMLPRNGDKVQVEDSAFLLGAVTAALARKADRGLNRPSELARNTTLDD